MVTQTDIFYEKEESDFEPVAKKARVEEIKKEDEKGEHADHTSSETT